MEAFVCLQMYVGAYHREKKRTKKCVYKVVKLEIAVTCLYDAFIIRV